MSDDLSRRRVLRRLGTGIAAGGLGGLAGCSGVVDDLTGEDGREASAYDGPALRSIPPESRPDVPERHPLSIPDELAASHRDGALDLLGDVPPNPEVPNGVVAERLASERSQVAEAIAESTGSDAGSLARLRTRRSQRADAAFVRGSYLAATDDLLPAAVESERERRIDERHAFMTEWDYEAADGVEAVALHRHIEAFVHEWTWTTEAWPQVPRDPVTDPFQAGSAVENLERAAASGADARALRERYRESTDTVDSYRGELTALAHRFRRRMVGWRRGRDEDAVPPVERDIEDTPAGRLHELANRQTETLAERLDRDLEDARYASAVVSGASATAAREAYWAFVEEIRAESFGPVESAEGVRERRAAAADALETALADGEALLTPPVAEHAADMLARGDGDLRRSEGRRRSVSEAVAAYRWVEAYATAVPAAVVAVERSLASDST